MTNNNDLEQAINLRDDDGYAIAIVKDGNVLYTSKARGIFGLYSAYESKLDFSDASVADRVVGAGVAMFMARLNIQKLNTNLISKPALDYLQERNIVVSYAKLVDYIANRNKDGKCPVETMADKSSDFDTFLNDVKQFLKRLEII